MANGELKKTGERSSGSHIRPNVAWSDLSPLERQVAQFVARGYTNGTIAQHLGKAVVHVARVVQILYMKSGISLPDGSRGRRVRGDRDRLTRWAFELLKSEERSS